MTERTFTPWGIADSITEIAPGIISYSTPSHGGIYLSPERVAEMPEPLRNFQPFTKTSGPGRWYEEDCDWAVVAVAFPQFFDADAVRVARETIKNWKPELHAQLAGWQVRISAQGQQQTGRGHV